MATYTGWKAALTAALGKVADITSVDQITLTAPLVLTVPAGFPAGQVYRVVLTQGGGGGHQVTYDGATLDVDLTAGALTTVEVWPGGLVAYPGDSGSGGGLTTEAVQDIVGAMVTGAGGTYDDASGTITLPGGGSSTITADDTPAAPAEGESASYLVTSAVTWPAGLVWSTDPDGGVAPTITGTALVSMFTVGGTTRAVMGATFPGVVAPDTTAPVAGTLAVVPSSTSALGTVTGASDTEALDAAPYSFRLNAGAWSAWQASASYTWTELTASTAYTFQHRVIDAAGNITEGTAVTDTTDAPSAYAWARRVTPEQTNPVTQSAAATTHTYTVAGTAGRLLVAGFSVDKDAGTITVSAGWNLVAYNIGASVSGALAWRVATGSDDITWTIGASMAACCDVHEFTGYASPTVDVFATFPDPPSETNKTSLAVTAGNATADGMAVAIAGQDTVNEADVPTQTVDSGYTMRSWNTAGTYGNTLLMATKSVSAGDSTAATFNFQPKSDQAFGIVAVFKG